jgi:uncharacterized damage-inducible protein DinB
MKPQELIEHWRDVRGALYQTVLKYSDGELRFAPFPNMYTAGELMLHIAHEEEIEVRFGITREWTTVPPPFTLVAYPSRAAVERLLVETHARTEVFLKTLTDADMERMVEPPWGGSYPLSDMLWHVLEHEIHHRGELSLMLGLLGKEGLDA